MPLSPDRRTLTSLRLAAQRIDSPVATTPREAVHHSLAMQGQDFAGAVWSAGLRTIDSRDATIEQSLADREIVRSWPMRGTLHLVAAEDLGWMLDVTTPRLVRGAATRRAQLGIDDAQLDRVRAIAVERLSGGRILSRDDLLAAFEAEGVSTASQRGYHFLWMLSQTGTLVFGPLEKQEGRAARQTFTLLDEWVASPRRLDHEASLAEFALRYFISHGPATVKDLAWWASLTMGEARAGLAAVRDRLEELQVDGTTYYLAPGLEPAGNGVHLLPGFDEYLLGYQDRSAPLAPEHSAAIVPGNNGMFKPTIVVNGEVVGTWSKTLKRGSLSIELIPFAPLSKTGQRDATAAAERLATFLGATLSSHTAA